VGPIRRGFLFLFFLCLGYRLGICVSVSAFGVGDSDNGGVFYLISRIALYIGS
jgi:hypothetical protein